MTKPASTDRGVVFDLASIAHELRSEPAYERSGHTARTLVREPDLRIVMVVVKGGSKIGEHSVKTAASIQGLGGHVRLRLPDRILDVTAGRLVVLEPGVQHDLEAEVDSAFLQTVVRSQGE